MGLRILVLTRFRDAPPTHFAQNRSDAKSSRLALKKLRKRTGTQKESPARCANERTTGAAQHVISPAVSQSEAGLGGSPLSHFEEAGRKVRARHCVIGIERKRVPEGVSRGLIFAIEEKETAKRGVNIRPPRCDLPRLDEDCPCLPTIIAVKMKARHIQSQLNDAGRKPDCAVNDRNRLGDPRCHRKLPRKFLKCWQEWRTTFGRTTQPLDGFFSPPCFRQRTGQQGLEPRIVAATDRLLQRRDGLLATALGDQSLSQDGYGGGIGPACLEHLGSKPFRLNELLHSQRQAGALEHVGRRRISFLRGRWTF